MGRLLLDSMDGRRWTNHPHRGSRTNGNAYFLLKATFAFVKHVGFGGRYQHRYLQHIVSLVQDAIMRQSITPHDHAADAKGVYSHAPTFPHGICIKIAHGRTIDIFCANKRKILPTYGQLLIFLPMYLVYIGPKMLKITSIDPV
jgi:hypothetical protein